MLACEPLLVTEVSADESGSACTEEETARPFFRLPHPQEGRRLGIRRALSGVTGVVLA
jgi:hypothetical protein